jgi:hypothetical protein
MVSAYPAPIVRALGYSQQGCQFFLRESMRPGFVHASNNLATLYLEQRRNLDKALKLAQTAKEKAPEVHGSR